MPRFDPGIPAGEKRCWVLGETAAWRGVVVTWHWRDRSGWLAHVRYRRVVDYGESDRSEVLHADALRPAGLS